MNMSNQMPPVVEELTEEYHSEKDNFYENDDETDMFFCCADWESQLTYAQPQHDDDIDLMMSPSNKRNSKFLEKLNQTERLNNPEVTHFDVDLVMKCPSSCGKLLGKRSKNTFKQASPKKMLKVVQGASVS